MHNTGLDSGRKVHYRSKPTNGGHFAVDVAFALFHCTHLIVNHERNSKKGQRVVDYRCDRVDSVAIDQRCAAEWSGRPYQPMQNVGWVHTLENFSPVAPGGAGEDEEIIE